MTSKVLNILVLEDSGTQARMITSMIADAGAVVAHAISVKEFSSQICTSGVQYDGVLVDVHFGEVSGLKLLPGILRRWPNAAVAMMTANRKDSFSVLAEARKMGAHFVLAKPFSKADIRFLLEDFKLMKETGARRKHVIVIDDSSTSCKIATTLLAEAGFRVSGFNDALEAVNQLSYDHVDIVLTDMNMPGMGGAELINLVRDIWSDVAIVAMSGDAHDAAKIGADYFLSKPFGAQELVSAIMSVSPDETHAEAHDEGAFELEC